MKLKHQILALLLICFLFAKQVHAQVSTVFYAQILTEDNQPLAGAKITFQKSGGFTESLAGGRVSFSFRGHSDTLVVSHIGYKTYKKVVYENTEMPLHIHMIASVTEMKEVTISTGYQDIPKERATGSFYKIDNQLLNERVGPGIISRLDGLTSSLLIDNRDPSQQTIQIRGLSTLNPEATSPLIILDNFPYSGDINNINPNDIESVTVLKDAAASSIWGARAGNGVIVLTTKKARAGQPLRVTFNTNLTLTPKPNLYTADQLPVGSDIDLEKLLFAKGYYDASFSDPAYPSIPQVAEILQKQKLGTISSTQASQQISLLQGQDVRNDMEKYLYRQAVNQQYYLNLTGSGSNIRYLVSAGLDRDQNSLIGNDNQRMMVRSNNLIDLTKKWQLQTDILLTQSNTHANSPGGYGNYATGTASISPYASLINSDGTPAASIFITVAHLPIRREKVNSLTGNTGRYRNWRIMITAPPLRIY